MYELALFAGIGGGILGGKILGWQTVCAVEKEAYPIGVLMQRQNDGALHPFPIWDDIRSFSIENEDTKPFIEHLRRIRHSLVVSGGFPCQDISVAGKGAGIDGQNSGLWREMRRVVCEIRPAIVFVENSPMLTSRGLHTILGHFSEMGYNALWGVLAASDIGANHQRKRIWVLAYDNEVRSRKSYKDIKQKQHDTNGSKKGVAFFSNTYGKRQQQSKGEFQEGWGRFSNEGKEISHTYRKQFKEQWVKKSEESRLTGLGRGSWWQTEPTLGRVADGYAGRVDELKGIGNGQVPGVAAAIYQILDFIKG